MNLIFLLFLQEWSIIIQEWDPELVRFLVQFTDRFVEASEDHRHH